MSFKVWLLTEKETCLLILPRHPLTVCSLEGGTIPVVLYSLYLKPLRTTLLQLGLIILFFFFYPSHSKHEVDVLRLFCL